MKILERKLELAKVNQRSTPWTYPYSYPTISYGAGYAGRTGG